MYYSANDKNKHDLNYDNCILIVVSLSNATSSSWPPADRWKSMHRGDVATTKKQHGERFPIFHSRLIRSGIIANFAGNAQHSLDIDETMFELAPVFRL